MLYSKYPEIKDMDLNLKISGLLIDKNVNNIYDFINIYLYSDKNLYYITKVYKYFRATSLLYNSHQIPLFLPSYDISETTTDFIINKMSDENKYYIKETILSMGDTFLINSTIDDNLKCYFLDDYNYTIGEFHLKSLLENHYSIFNKENIIYSNTEQYYE